MAIRPDYTIGTITLTSGSSNFTTSGSSLQSGGVQAGDSIITRSGDVLIIATITGQNAGTLFQPCPASAAGSAQPLRIRFQPDGSRYQGAARDLIARWGQSGNVDAFAGLAGVVDGVPVFTGAGTMDVLPKSEFGPDDVYGNLEEIAALAKINNQFIVMGSDGSITLKPISDITDAIATNATNIATNADNITSLQNNKFDKPSGSLAQFLRGNGSPQSVVGTVTQAAGGAIIQRGSNANGEFVRYADGTQICWSPVCRTGGGSTFSSNVSWIFPSTFSTSYRVNGSVAFSDQNNISSDNGMRDGAFYFIQRGASNADIGILSNGRLTSNGWVDIISVAIGRWF